RQAVSEVTGLVLVNLGLDPDGRKIGDVKKPRRLLDPFPLDLIFLDHVSVDGRAQRDVRDRFAGPLDLPNLIVAKAPESQPLPYRIAGTGGSIEQVLHGGRNLRAVNAC